MDESTSTTETVTKTSSGKVKITVEEYNRLQAQANEPKNVIYNRIEKTAEMQAKDMVALGAFSMGGGGALFVLGLLSFLAGKKQLKSLDAAS